MFFGNRIGEAEMRAFFSFPEERIVRKKLTKEHFLHAANLTQFEKDYLSQTVSGIDILYDSVFPNHSELLVFAVSIDKTVDERTEQQVAKSVAQAISHRSAVLVQNHGVFHFFVFDGHYGKQNCRRFIVDKTYSSPPVRINPKDDLSYYMKAEIETALRNSSSAEDLNRRWKTVISECWEYKKELNAYSGEEWSDWLLFNSNSEQYQEYLGRFDEFEQRIKEEKDNQLIIITPPSYDDLE